MLAGAFLQVVVLEDRSGDHHSQQASSSGDHESLHGCGSLWFFQMQQAAVFSKKALVNILYATCSAPNSRQTQLATS